MRAKLFSKSGTFKGQSFAISGDTTIGRRKDNVIVLRTRTVSSRHARIYPDEAGESFLLEDLGSLNGTRIDGIRAVGAERLGALHVITFADDVDFIFRIQSGAGAVREPTMQEESAPSWPGEPSPQASGSPTTLHEGDIARVPDFLLEPSENATEPLVDEAPPLVLTFRGEQIELAEGEHTIGRDEDASVTLSEHSVSRRHATLTWREGRALLRDLGSSNGTFVEDRRIDSEERLDLPAKVRLGAVEVTLEEGGIAHD